MKISSLSYAVIMALGVVACGGSGNGSSQTLPENDSGADTQSAPAPETPAAHDSTLVDPTQTHVVDDKDLSKQSTVGALQYIRRDSSQYDRSNNPDKPASSTPLLGVPLDVQNPKLTNIVLARQDLMREDGQPVRAQFAGGFSPEPLTREGRPQAQPSLQVMNFENVDILAGIYKLPGSAAEDADGNPIANNTMGDKQDYDKHVADNVGADGKVQRDRVSHVYTLRFEYLQPYADYPNAVNPRDPGHYDNPVNHQHRLADADYIPPGKPTVLPSEAQLKAGAATRNATVERLGSVAHAHNTGLGHADLNQGGSWSQNEKWRYIQGGRTHAPVDGHDYVYGSGWNGIFGTNGWAAHNQLTATAPRQRIDVNRRWNNRNPESYPNDAYPGWRGDHNYFVNGRASGSKNGNYDGWEYEDNMSFIGPRQKGDPRYPNEPYDKKHNATLTPGLNPFSDADYGHNHTYLEVDEFTAIRRQKLIRPLVNPDPNVWRYTLKEFWVQEVWEDTDGDGTGDAWVNKGSQEIAYSPARDYGRKPAGSVPAIGDIKWTLDTAQTRWVGADGTDNGRPAFIGGGIQGEFRGPAYQGWLEDYAVVRWADPRIQDPKYARKYGADLVWWSTQDSAFENHATRNGWDPRARRVDNNIGNDPEDLVRTQPWDEDVEIQPTGDITNGLIRIGNMMKTLGQELRWDADKQEWQNWHNTKTRIFGRYHLAWADQGSGEIKQTTFNSYSGARSFVARTTGTVAGSAIPDGEQEGGLGAQMMPESNTARFAEKADLDSDVFEWSIGAKPMTLTKVQYGRVTANLDLDVGEGPFDGGFLHAPFAYKNDDGSVDNYFYRGVETTTIEQMAELPKQGKVKYEGHALMYGINNDFLGWTDDRDPNKRVNLPNAFALDSLGSAQLGLGNFVKAEVDFAGKTVEGSVYNAWLVNHLAANNPKGEVVHDHKVHFKGDIMGNTAIGTADRVYIKGDDKADFRASFFGSGAEEMGGAFNTVTREEKYGSAYEDADWGGVFGAKRTSAANNTFQGDDGTPVYSNTSP